MTKKSIVLLSGGMDSATCLAIAKAQGFHVYALSFAYGQRHAAELNAAKLLAEKYAVEQHRVIQIDMGQFGGSALTDHALKVPTQDKDIVELEDAIPITYVPARNTIFLSYALAWAEVLAANDIFIGVTAIDYSGYPDCRPEYIQAFEQMGNLATKAAIEGQKLSIHTPLIRLSKKEIILQGIELGVDYSTTITCYQADVKGRACGQCDACHLRKLGFNEANVVDNTIYQTL